MEISKPQESQSTDDTTPVDSPKSSVESIDFEDTFPIVQQLFQAPFDRSLSIRPTSSPPPQPFRVNRRFRRVFGKSLDPNSPVSTSSESPESKFNPASSNQSSSPRTVLSRQTVGNASDASLVEGIPNFCSSINNHFQMSYSPSSPSQGGNNGINYHFKILVPAVAAGAIIGKGGETIGALQRDTGTRVKMSKANDFYPSTNERVCLISGSREGILKMNDFIMEKIREKPDPNAKPAMDFDNKQTVEREKQVKVLVPNSTAGMIIGKQGGYIEKIKRDTGAYVQISQKSTGHALLERCITVIGDLEAAKQACAKILDKIIDDPQSGTCTNVSYADTIGPVANHNPTGSPYAGQCGPTSGGSNGPLCSANGVGPLGGVHNSGGHSVPGNGAVNSGGIVGGPANNSNANYSSNGSLNSLSPGTINNFSNGGPGGSNTLMPMNGVFQSQPSGALMAQIDQFRLILRHLGFSESIATEICNATVTLVTYNMLNLAATFAGQLPQGLTINGTPPPMHAFGASGFETSLQIGGLSPAHPHSHPHAHGPTNTGIFGPGSSGLESGPGHHGNGGSQTGIGGMFGPVGSMGGPGPFQTHGGRGDRAGATGQALTLNANPNDPSGGMFDNFTRPASPPPVAVAGPVVPGTSGSNVSGSFSNIGRTNSSPVVDNAQEANFTVDRPNSGWLTNDSAFSSMVDEGDLFCQSSRSMFPASRPEVNSMLPSEPSPSRSFPF